MQKSFLRVFRYAYTDRTKRTINLHTIRNVLGCMNELVCVCVTQAYK
jgi:hypothetical protein